MLYTVGHTESYEKGLREHLPFNKLGKGKDHLGKPYAGGCVFETVEQAKQYLINEGKTNTYSVYGLDTDITNTEQLAEESFRRLLEAARIIKL